MENKVDRAKQFAPFEALKGLREALVIAEMEHDKKRKIELSEESEKDIQCELAKIGKDDAVRVKWYKHGFYKTIVGKIAKIDKCFKFFVIENERIDFENIYFITKITI